MTVHIVATLQDNYTYILADGNHALIIDCGEAGPVIEFLKAHKLNPLYVLCTHHHYDHIDGLPGLKAAYPDIKIGAPQKDLYRIAIADFGIEDGESLNLSGHDIMAIETPGHTANHLCFHLPREEIPFSGDTLFSGGCGRLFEGTPEEMFRSLKILNALPGGTMIYAGHEYSQKNMDFALSIEPDNAKFRQRLQEIGKLRAKGKPTLPVSLRDERDNNIFLQSWTVEDFARLRELRNHF